MSVLEFTLFILLAAFLSGVIGALSGMGGGMIIIPLLVLIFKVHTEYAIGASLVAVIATSCGAAALHARDGFSNLRIGVLLELAATAGALAGAYSAAWIPLNAIEFTFAIVLLYSTWQSLRPPPERLPAGPPDPLAQRLGLYGECPGDDGSLISYCARRVRAGLGIMGLAGILSGLLGIGSGAVKVLAMDQCMRLPYKVSTATSNFMVGVTAAASAGVYLNRGYIDPALATPVMLGTLAGSLAGAFILARAHVPVLRKIFTGVVGLLGVQMLFKCFGYEF
jgi:hypothetical protein